MTYHHQNSDHSASIAADPDDDATVHVQIAVGDTVSVDLWLYPDTAAALARDLTASAVAVAPYLDEGGCPPPPPPKYESLPDPVVITTEGA